MFLSCCACAGVAEKGGGSIYSWYISIKEVGDTSDRGGGLWESEGGTYAILIVHNRLLSHRHLHHMGQNYPLSMDGATNLPAPPSQWLPKLYHYICRNHIGPNIRGEERYKIQCSGSLAEYDFSDFSLTLVAKNSLFLEIYIKIRSTSPSLSQVAGVSVLSNNVTTQFITLQQAVQAPYLSLHQ